MEKIPASLKTLSDIVVEWLRDSRVDFFQEEEQRCQKERETFLRGKEAGYFYYPRPESEAMAGSGT